MKSKRFSLARVFGTSALIVFAGLLMVGSSAAQKRATTKPKILSHPYLNSWYDGRRNLPLAAYSGGTLTEQDLFLYGLMKRDANPALFQNWEKSRRAKERESLAQNVENALRDLASTLLLADRTAGRSPSPTEAKYIRFLKYPVYHLVWIQKVLNQKIKIEQIDLIKQYHDHVDEFYTPESVRVRYIFREVSTTATLEERDAAQKEVDSLRVRAAAGEDFVELARAKSDAPSAVRGGELPPFSRGMFTEDFETHAFALEPGQLSPVFLGRGGFYLIQCLEKLPEKQVSFKAAEKDLRETVEQKTLAYLYNYHLSRMLRGEKPTARADRFRDLLPQEDLITLGDYRLSQGEFLDMFPYVITEPLESNQVLIGQITQDIVRGEVVAQQIEQLDLAGDPLLVAADRLARRIWRSREALRTILATPPTFSESEVKNYYEANRKQLGYQPQWRVLNIEATVRNPYLHHPSQLEALRAELRSQFEQTLRDFQTAFREERLQATEELRVSGESSPTLMTAASVPDDEAATATARYRRQALPKLRCLRVLTEASTTDFQFTVADLGYRSARDENIYSSIKDLSEGDCGPIATLPRGGFTCYFVAGSIAGAPLDYDKARVHVRQQYIASLQAERLQRLRKELTDKMALRVSFPEIGGSD